MIPLASPTPNHTARGIYRSRRRLTIIQGGLLALTTALTLGMAPQVTHAQTPPAPSPAPPDPQTPPQPQRRRNPGVPQTPTPNGPAAPGTAPGGGAPGMRGAAATPPAKPRPYAEVVTKEAKTQYGLFTTHQIDDRVYFEIPAAQLGKELLWVTTYRQTQTGYGYGGTEVQNRVVRWEKRGDKILLRSVDYQARPDVEGSLKQSIALAGIEPILMAFDVKAYNDKADNAPVIDVTPLLTGDTAEFSPRRQLGPGAHLDAARTFVDRVKPLPQNIEMDVLSTYVLPSGAAAGGGFPGRPDTPGPRRDFSTEAATLLLHHSLVTLPATPMKPRLFDDRVGYFDTGFYEFGSPENRVQEVRYIHRWRLEKKDPTAALSEPVKPIVYYIGPEVPAKWHPYIKQAVEDWQPAFEQAGFKNAIVCKEAPTPQEDPDFDPDDVRYSVIRWLPSTTENAYGPSIVDPRTGEILNADIKVFHNVLKLAETWYFTQASPNDPRARKLPLPDPLMGQLIRYVLSHEVGHTLGLRHNMLASSTYSIARLRDPKWTSKWGDEASIMDYGRFNYVAQPGDGVRLIPKQGPYDYFAIEWGYSPIPGAKTPDDEKARLNQIASRQLKDPMLRFGPGPEDAVLRDDPHQQSEDLGDDPIAATTLGLKNIDRVFPYLVPATEKPGEDYDRLSEVYNALLDQRARELDHVAVLVGGVVNTNNHYAAGDPDLFTPIPAARQRAAVQFLLQHGFTTPADLLRPDILNRISPSGIMDRVLSDQQRLLGRLTGSDRLQRMADWEARRSGKGIYGPLAFLDDLRGGIWSELSMPAPAHGTGGGTGVVIDPYRRNLQSAYISILGAKLAPDAGTPSAVRAVVRGNLMDTKASISAALGKTTDRATRLHLIDCNETLQQILYPHRG